MLIARKTSELLTLRTLTAAVRCYSKDYSSSDDEKDSKDQKRPKKPQETEKKEEESAATRLNRLLSSMQTDDSLTLSKQAAPSMARPGEGAKLRKEAAKQAASAKDIFVAAKRVADLLGPDNKKQAESELLSKLLGHDNAAAATKSGGESAGQENELSLSDLIVGMKIDRSQQLKGQTRAEFVRRSLAAKGLTQQEQQRVQPRYERSGGFRAPERKRPEQKREAETFTGSVNLFGGEPLGIFKETAKLRESPDMLATWAHLYRQELKLQVARPPANYYEKIALWTEQGKVWRFPIDNEQDMCDEVDVDFSEHVFLEQHLEAWCPTKGPIRHFMELVCVGLSKNPYLTAKEKKEHVLWYRDYFEAKKDILKDLMSKDKMAQLNASSEKLEG